MNFEGDLQQVDLSWVLQRVSADACTGILTVQGMEDIVAISLLSGRIVAADSFNQTLEDGLGDVLVEQGVIEKFDFDAAAAEHPGGSAGSLGDFLVQRDLISRDQLLQGLRLQTYHLMLQVLDWRSGEYKFYVGDEVSYEDGFQAISAEELLIRNLKEKSGQGLELPEPDRVYRRLPANGQIHVLGQDGEGSEDGIWLSRPQIAFAEKIDGQRTANQVAEALQLDSYQTRFFLYRLSREGLIEATASTRLGTAELTLPSLEATGDLQAEIFLPPDPGGVALDEDFEEEDSTRELPSFSANLPLLLAAILALLLGAGLLLRSDAFLLPYPWQDIQRETLARQLRESLFLKFDRAAKSFFLMQAHYPDRAEELVEQGLLSRNDLSDPTGHRLRYTADELRYQVSPLIAGSGDTEGMELSESITGDFLLDPQFTPVDSLEQAPLYLID